MTTGTRRRARFSLIDAPEGNGPFPIMADTPKLMAWNVKMKQPPHRVLSYYTAEAKGRSPSGLGWLMGISCVTVGIIGLVMNATAPEMRGALLGILSSLGFVLAGVVWFRF
jgi:hypothetical protein